jgi:hypothetical protein
MRSSRTKGSKSAPVVSGPAEDPILPFSVTISKDEMPRSYSGIPFDPQIFFGAQANGFYGNIRYKLLGATRIFFFQLQPGQQNMTNYYTIAVVVPGKKTKISPVEQKQLDIIMGLCNRFESKNSRFIDEYTTEAVKFVNLAVQYLANQQGSDAWGPVIPPGTPVGMTVVFNQLDMGQLNEFYDPSEFPIASIDFTPTKGGIRRRRSSKKRKRISKKRKSTRKRKSIRRK